VHGLLDFNIAECETPEVSSGSGVLSGGVQAHLHAHAHAYALKPVLVYKIMKISCNQEEKKPVGRPRHRWEVNHSFTRLACAECDNLLLFPGASPIPVSYIPFSTN
jgi:hypothetical protein